MTFAKLIWQKVFLQKNLLSQISMFPKPKRNFGENFAVLTCPIPANAMPVQILAKVREVAYVRTYYGM